MDDIRMTRYGRGGGCACKIPPGELETLLKGLTDDARAGDAGELLVGPEHGDDAAVVRLGPGLAAISTADFFTPVVDDPYTWGRIAATNAMSDVYAMGGTPVMAVNLLAWPRETLPMEIAREVLRGGLDAARAMRLSGGGRAQHRLAGPALRHGRDGHRRPGAADHPRPGRTRAAADADQTAGGGGAQHPSQGHG